MAAVRGKEELQHHQWQPPSAGRWAVAAHVGPLNRCRRRRSLPGASAALLSGRLHDRGTHNDLGLLLDLGRGHSSGRHTGLVRTGGR